MKTPLENIAEWFNALPVTYRQAVAVEVATLMPGHGTQYQQSLLSQTVHRPDQ